MRKLKLFFACLLMTVLSIGQVWASNPAVDDVIFKEEFGGNNIQASAYTFTGTTTWSGSTTGLSYASTSTSSLLSNATANPITSDNFFFVKASASTLTMSGIAIPSNVTEVTVSFQSNKTIVNCTYSFTGGDDYATGATSISGVQTFDIDCTDESTLYLKFTKTGTSSNARIDNVTVTVKAVSGGGSDPSLTVTPTSWDFGEVAVSDEASKVFSVSGSNLTAGTLSISVPEGFSVSPSSISVTEATLAATNITVSKNTTAIDDYSGNLSISATCGLTEAKTVALEMSVVADPEPTGTFELFSGDITEGDYVIYYGGGAMNTTVTSNRLQYLSVTPAENKLVNPNEAIIWHIAASGDYWTLYNAAVEKYAGGTSTKNQGAMLASVTDYAKWTITGSSTYEFENLGRATGSSDTGNKWLRKNGTYGFACYSSTQSGTGPLTLYKKSDGKPAAPTFTPAAGSYLEAQSVTISAAAGVDEIRYTLDESTPTAFSTLYSGAIPVSSTTTIKAIAIKDAVEGHVATATYTIWDEPLSVAAAIALIPNANDQVNDQFVEGYVCTAGTSVSSGKMTYYISADGKETNRLQIYKGKNLDDTEFSNVSDLAIGDKVVVFGQLKNYGGTPEMNDGNYIVSYTAKGALSSVVVSGTPTKTVYANNEAFEPAGLVVTATYASGYAIEVTPTSWSATPSTITATGNVEVTATFGGMTSDVYNVAVTKASKTLVSIAVDEDQFEQWQGLELPKPTVTATYSEGDPEDVTSQAEFTGYDASTTGDQEITVTYTFGGHDETANYTVTVKSIYNVELAASVARNLIVNVVGNTESTDDMIVRGKVSYINNASSNAQTYWISDDGTRTNEVEIYKGKYLSGADFTSANQLRVGDEVVVIGKVINYNNNTPEFANGKSEVQSHVRTPNFAITDVTALEVGATDLAVADLTINVEGEGAVTLASSDHTEYVSIVDGKLRAVAAGDATITANLAANGIYKAASTTFDVHVIAATIKYAITFDGNGGSGDAPEFAAEAAAGAEVTLPANSYTYTGHNFTGWKVYDENEDEVTVTANAFTMPASPVTIKAQWAEIPVWAYTYTSNVAMAHTGSGVDNGTITIGTDDPYLLVKAGASSSTGTIVVTVPEGTTDLHFHAFAWGGKTAKIELAGVENASVSEFNLAGEAGASGSGNDFTLQGDPVDQYFHVSFDAVAAETEITFSKATGSADNRFFFYGVNQEGGVVPVLKSIEISGDLTTKSGYKAGDALDLDGLTVNAIYTLNDVDQAPVDVTSLVNWSYGPLVEGQTSVTITATLEDKSDDITISDLEAVASADPMIYVDPSLNVNFGSVEVGEDVPANKTITVTLTNVAAATATLGGTNAEAFSIDKTALVEGENVITISVIASTAAAASYSATITITDNAAAATEKVVNLSFAVTEPVIAEAPVATDSKWVPATEITDGMQVLIVGVNNTDYSAMGVQNNNNRAAVAASVDGEGVLTPGENTMAFTVVEQSDGTFALRTSNGKYLYAASSSSNYLRSQDELDDNGRWTLTVNSAVANGTYTHNMMQFNSSSSIFACYTTSTTTQKPIALYVPKQDTPEPPTPATPDYTRDVTNGHYGTICLPKAGTIEGATLYEIGSFESNMIYVDEVGTTLAAGVPYIFYASEAQLNVYYTDKTADDVPASDANGLYGFYNLSNENATYNIPEDADNYILYNDQYWLVSGRAAYIANYRAYIKLGSIVPKAAAPGRRRVAMNVNGEQVATGFENLNASEKPVKLMIDGNIFILRGEKLYDATGRLVK